MSRAMRVLVVLAIVVSSIGGIASAETARIPLSDGVTLAAEILLPPQPGPHPVILTMTPYGPATYFSQYRSAGYAHVNVDIRGTGGSDGAFCVFCDREQQDVYDVVEWIAAQPWSDGNVGMMGGSYQGITPMLGAAKQPPHLKAIVPSVVYADAYRDIVWHNGIYNYNFVTQWAAVQTALSATGTSPAADYTGRIDTWIAARAREIPFDDERWREMAIYTKWDKITVPTLLLGQWFDGFTRGTIWNFQGIASQHKRLIMSPGTHKGKGGAFDPLTPYTNVPPRPGATDPTRAWFDRFLRNIDNGIEHEPAVTYYDLGAHRWEQASTWPPPDAALSTLYLSGARSGSAISGNDGSLTASPPAGAATAADGYTYSPAAGSTETLSKWGTVAATPHVRVDQRPDEAQSLTYTTDALTSPVALAGPIRLDLWAQTDASNTDFIAKVTDVAPDGSSMLMTTGYMRASRREVDHMRSKPAEPWISNARDLPVPKWAAFSMQIDIWHIGYELQPGHRLRLTIMSADATNHEPLLEPARNIVFHDDRYPSRLILTTR